MHNDLKGLTDQILLAMSRISDEQAFLKDLYAQAKAKGYDVSTLRRAVRLIDTDGIKSYRESVQLLDTYLSNVGQLSLF